MNTCPHCGIPVAIWRRFLTPKHVRCPACGKLCRVSTSVKVLAFGAPIIAILVLGTYFSARAGDIVLFSTLGISFLVLGTLLQGIGPLVPESEVTVAASVGELRALKFSGPLLLTLVLMTVASGLFFWLLRT